LHGRGIKHELQHQGWLSKEDLDLLNRTTMLPTTTADHMVENVIGLFELPFGIALNFLINGEEILIPMVIEEPSVIAGASNIAKLVRSGGGFITDASAPEMIGQIQLLDIANLAEAKSILLENKDSILALAADADPILQKLGGGPRDLEIRTFDSSPIGQFLVVQIIYDVRDAMGANAINTMLEKIAPFIEKITAGRVHLRILSNLADRRLAQAKCVIPLKELEFKNYSAEQVRDGIIAAWAFAAVDPYRAATHNKGIMNGVDAVVIATGNDWRAIEAGAHAYAARNGKYTSLSTWKKDAEGNLVGELEMPMAVGIIGGATKVHPAAQLALRLMKVDSASKLAKIIAAVGLAQNLAALKALATEGIQRGHMSLHARQVAIAAGAKDEQIEKLAQMLVDKQQVRIDYAENLLKKWNEINS